MESPASKSQPFQWFEQTFARLEESWNAIQVGRQGSYSVERLESFDHYCKTTSRVRVISVCVLTPVPPLVTIVLLECMPLRPPSDGWAANWVFWIRLAMVAFIMAFSGTSQMVTLVPDMNPTFIRRQLVAWFSTTLYVGGFLVAAYLLSVFPIPLLLYIGGFFVGIYHPVVMVLVFGKQTFSPKAPCHHNLQQYMSYFRAFVAISNVYPLYKVMYGFVPVAYRAVVVFVMPIWRLGVKRFVVGAVRPLEDYIPGIVAMTVDFYSTLFASVCMTTSSSAYLSVLFIGADIGQSLLEFREVRANANVVFELLRDRHKSSERFQKGVSRRGSFTNNPKASNLIALVLAVTRDPTSFHIATLKNVRLRACFPHPLSKEQEAALRVLGETNIYDNVDTSSRSPTPKRPWAHRIRVKRATIAPTTSNIITTTSTNTEEANTTFSPVEVFSATLKHNAVSGKRSKALVQQSLALLFHCEYLVLVEYVECIVPLIYLIFKLALENLPNVVFYPGGAGNFGPEAALSIFVFALLEIGSLILLNIFIERKFDYSPLYQLTFVLETQIYLVQPMLFLNTVFLLQYELEHYGKVSTNRQWSVLIH
ncbi:hypothetical protein P3T76_002938 [Phytophthora citrophthora]|uniref:Transmembrane protein n=1 Tax=Phytophthora citrophthora TaxID=4793 RepID=A0AAD9LQF7_9STRA|nr:hypothetical protein P3T76_002938 [Phytophthora citrophthora]